MSSPDKYFEERLSGSVNQSNSFLKAVKIFLTVAGLTIMLGGVVTGLILALGALLTPGAGLDSAIVGAACLAVGGGLGGALAWQAGRASLKRPSISFWLPPVISLLLIFIPLLIIGQVVITFDLWPFLTFPPLHVAAAVIPSLAILAFAGRILQAVDFQWREMIIHLAGGAFLATSCSFILEIGLGLLILGLVFLATSLTPGGAELLERLAAAFQEAALIEDPQALSELLLSPPIAATIVLVFIVAAPLIEELAKIAGLMAMSYRRPGPARAFGWGVAAGAGFGLMENVFNTIAGLEIWALVILMRVGATLMHCLNGGLMGLGWSYFLNERRPLQLLGFYGLAFLIHAAWNGAVIGIAGAALLATGVSSTELTQSVSGGVVVVCLVFLLILASVITITFIFLTYRLRDGLSPPVEPAPRLSPPPV